ncbi:transketolase [Caulobacter sp. S45]|uniref:transketolase n=1 Tax=Caulobacter sp. S45 TaxID=1641861 RepID=UPI001C2D78AC|nr:transketolase [Caulobacter sp. S45]
MDDAGYFPGSALAMIKARLLKMHFDARVGHIGGNLSCIDAVAHLHLQVMLEDDVFVLSKGHAAGALYATLWATGDITEAELLSYYKDGTHLAAHPAARWNRRIRFGTGSLGHGLGLATGVAFAKRLRHEAGTTYCLMGDGECQEGSIWEAAAFAQHHGLSNLVCLVDANGWQGFGRTGEVGGAAPLAGRFRALGLQVEEIGGHSSTALDLALRRRSEGPLVVVLDTVKGHGVSFMEDRMEWHYLPMSPDQYDLALQELEAA